MKKMLLNFAENLISKEQMSKIKGGCGSCGVTGNITCGGGGQHIASAQTPLEMAEIIDLLCSGGGQFNSTEGSYC